MVYQISISINTPHTYSPYNRSPFWSKKERMTRKRTSSTTISNVPTPKKNKMEKEETPLLPDVRMEEEPFLIELVKQALPYEIQLGIVRFHHSPLLTINCFPKNKKLELNRVIRSGFMFFKSDPHRTRYLFPTKIRLLLDVPHGLEVPSLKNEILLILPLNTEVLQIDIRNIYHMDREINTSLTRELLAEIIPTAFEQECKSLKGVELLANERHAFFYLLMNEELKELKGSKDRSLTKYYDTLTPVQVHPFYKGKLRHYSSHYNHFCTNDMDEMHKTLYNAFPELVSLMNLGVHLNESTFLKYSELFKNLRRLTLAFEDQFPSAVLAIPKLHTLHLQVSFRHNRAISLHGMEQLTTLKKLKFSYNARLKEDMVITLLSIPNLESLSVECVDNWCHFFQLLSEKTTITKLTLYRTKDISHREKSLFAQCKSIRKLTLPDVYQHEGLSGLFSILVGHEYIQTLDISVNALFQIEYLLLGCQHVRHLIIRTYFGFSTKAVDQEELFQLCQDTLVQCKETRLRYVRIISCDQKWDRDLETDIKGVKLCLE